MRGGLAPSPFILPSLIEYLLSSLTLLLFGYSFHHLSRLFALIRCNRFDDVSTWRSMPYFVLDGTPAHAAVGGMGRPQHSRRASEPLGSATPARYRAHSHPRPRQGTHRLKRISGSKLRFHQSHSSMLHGSSYAATGSLSGRVKRNSVPSIHIRWRITASFLATAKIARRSPDRRLIDRPQAFSAEHFWTRTMIDDAAS